MKYLLSITLLLFCMQVKAQAPVPFIYDKDQSMFFGAYNSIFVQKAVYTFQDKYIPDTLWNESRFGKKILGMGYRFSKLFLLDLQEDFLITLTQHEAFGHTARYREFGSRNNTVKISMLFPFGNGSGSSQYGTIINNYTPHKSISVSIAGVEANMVMSNIVANNVLLRDTMHYREALLYLIAQNDQLLYIWADRLRDPSGNGGGDMLGYVSKLNGMYDPVKQPYSINRLSQESLISLLNPVQLYAAFTLIYTYGFKGKNSLQKFPCSNLAKCAIYPC